MDNNLNSFIIYPFKNTTINDVIANNQKKLINNYNNTNNINNNLYDFDINNYKTNINNSNIISDQRSFKNKYYLNNNDINNNLIQLNKKIEIIKEPVKEPIKEIIKEPVKESIKEIIKEPVREPIKESIKESIKEPVKEPVKEPIKESIKEPVKEPIKEHIKEPITKIIQESVKEPIKEPIIKIIQESVKENKLLTNNLNESLKYTDDPCTLGIKIGIKESLFNKLIYKIVEFITPKLRELGLTPNDVTKISLYFSYMTYKKLLLKDVSCIYYYFIYMVLDYADGYMARKYKMYSDIGDLYDHSRDIISHIIFFFIICKDYKIAVLFIIGQIVGLSVFGCQELLHNKYCKKTTNNTINWLKKYCIQNEYMDIFNYYIGTSISYIITIICLYLYCIKK